MRTIVWLPLAAFLLFAAKTSAEDARTNVVSFTNLQQAVDSIASALETTNFTSIGNACLEDYILRDLQRVNEKTPLRKLYADKSFPTNALTFKLGGHGSELRHTHIDFVKTNDVWRLKAIWICR